MGRLLRVGVWGQGLVLRGAVGCTSGSCVPFPPPPAVTVVSLRSHLSPAGGGTMPRAARLGVGEPPPQLRRRFLSALKPRGGSGSPGDPPRAALGGGGGAQLQQGVVSGQWGV